MENVSVGCQILNGFLEGEIYVEQPEGFLDKGNEDKVYLLEKALYGLMTYFLGMEIKQSQDEVFICKKKYVLELMALN